MNRPLLHGMINATPPLHLYLRGLERLLSDKHCEIDISMTCQFLILFAKMILADEF